MLNSVISTKLAKFLDIDLKDFYFGTPLFTPEYMLVPLNMIPQEMMEEYNILPLVHNDMVAAEISKGMYCLPQAGRIAYDKLVKHLALGGYVPTGKPPGLFKHTSRPIYSCLVVDNFGVKYTSPDDTEHLITHLSKEYKCTTDWDDNLFLGIHLDWDYTKRTADLSMKNYITKGRLRFGHNAPSHPQHSPHPLTPRKYGAKVQMADNPTITPLTPAEKLKIQQFVGVFRHYVSAIDTTMLAAISRITTNMSTATA